MTDKGTANSLRHMLLRPRPLSDLGIIACGLLLLQLLGEYLLPHYWLLSNFSTFRLQYGIVAAVAALLLLLGKRPKPALLAIALTIWYLAHVLFYSMPGPALASDGLPLRILYANVYTRNTQTAGLRALITDFDPDIVALAETGRHWGQALQYLRDRYPAQLEAFRDDNFGMAFYSRLPGRAGKVIPAPGSHIPAIRMQATWEGRTVTIWLAHPLPPSNPRQFAIRDQYLAWLAKRISEEDGPVIMAGDLNATESVASFREFLAVSGLRDTRRGFGWQPSWPVFRTPPFIPLDHLCVSPEWAVIDRRLGPAIGSDHLPVCLTVAFGSST